MNILKEIKRIYRGEVPLSVLLKRGLTIGENFSMQSSVTIDPCHCWLVKIGDNVTLAPHVQILAHDASTKRWLGYSKIGRVIIGNNVFVGAGTIIFPSVSIGNNVIIGAGGVITHDLPDNGVYVGAPAKFLCSTDKYIEKEKECMKVSVCYDESYTLYGGASSEKKNKMIQDLENHSGFIR